MNNISLVYMVAGVSSRFGGNIKGFAEVGPNGEKLIEVSLQEALPQGFNKIVFIVSPKTEKAFKEFFKNNYKGIPVQYALQSYDENKRDKPWGTTDAICSAKEVLNEPFVICNGDDLYGAESFQILVNHLKKTDEPATIGYTLSENMPDEGTVNRGVFYVDENNYVTEIKEMLNINKQNLEENNLSPNDFCSMNIFALNPEVISFLDEKLKEFKKLNNHERKIESLLPKELSILINEGKIKMKVYPSQTKCLGITNIGDEKLLKEQLEQLKKL